MAYNSPSHRSSGHLRLVAFAHVGRILSLANTFGFAVVALGLDNPNWLIASGFSLFLWTVFALVHLAEAPRTRCAVCTASLLDRTTCAKHRKASRTLGGYRLNTALQILGSSHYDCHHCGEHVFCGLGEHLPTSDRPHRRPAPSGTPITELPSRRDEVTLHKTSSNSLHGGRPF